MSVVLLLAAISIIAIYLMITLVHFGVPDSISYTNYLWGKDTHIFTAVIWAIAILLCISWVNASDGGTAWLAFLSCAGLGYVGAAACYKEKLTCTVHYSGAIVWAVAGIVWTLIHGMYYPFVLGGIVCVAGLVFNKLSNIVFWLELGMITILVTGLMRYEV